MKLNFNGVLLSCCIMILSSSSVMAISVHDETNHNRTHRGEFQDKTLSAVLYERTRLGELKTSMGDYKISNRVEVVDERPKRSWYEKKEANILMIFDNESLEKVFIYE